MKSGFIRVEIEDLVATVTLDRPERSNAFTIEMMEDLAQAFRELSQDEAVRVVVLRGGGRKAFSTGMDAGSLMEHAQEVGDHEGDPAGAPQFPLASCRKPVLAMIYGRCIGGALGMISACDMRYAAANASFVIPAAKLGVVYPVAACWGLNRLIGPANLSEMLFSARRYSAQEAQAMGLVNRCFPEEELESAVYALAREIAANSPVSVSGAKKVIRHIQKDPKLEAAGEVERLVSESFLSEDFKQGVKAFLEKRTPHFAGK